MRWQRFFFASSFAIALCLPVDLPCQTSTTGALSGIVTDPTQAVLPNATIEIEDLAKGTIQTTKTDAHGGYRLSFLVPGKYALAETKATLTVTGEVPLVQAENGDVSAPMNQTVRVADL